MIRARSSLVLLAAGAAAFAVALAVRSGGSNIDVAPPPRSPDAPAPEVAILETPPPTPARPSVPDPGKKLSAREVSVLVNSLQEPPLRDAGPAREKVLRTLEANPELARAALRQALLNSPAAGESIRDALKRVGE